MIFGLVIENKAVIVKRGWATDIMGKRHEDNKTAITGYALFHDAKNKFTR